MCLHGKWLAGFQPRMQAPFSYLTAEVETRFGYVGVERIETHWWASSRVC
jgi:hypothetical protein